MNSSPNSIDWFQTANKPWFVAPFFRWSLIILGVTALGAGIFELMGISVFKLVGWAHSYCYLRDPRMIALHVVSDSLIGGAYVSISSTLAYIVYKASKDIPFNWVFLAFGLFIVSCGFTHFMEIWVVWQPVYWLAGYVKVITAAASVATAVALFPLVPKIFVLINTAKQSEKRRLEVERLNTELERFNYSVAHDLRAPLRGITGYAQVIAEDYGDRLDDTCRSYLQRISETAVRMDTLLVNLLRYSSVAGDQIEIAPVNLRKTLDTALESLRIDLRERGATVAAPETMPDVLANDTLVAQVFQNVIANAIKFVAPGVAPRVTIQIEEAADNLVRVSVTDNGIGIRPEHRQKLFQIFERISPEFPGTGVGLATAQRALQRMDGEIGVEPWRDGEGTTFWFTLRRA